MKNKTKRIGILLVGILAVILISADKNRAQSVEKYIIKPDKIQSVQISDETGNVIKEIDGEAGIKQLTDILNRAVYDDDMNDGRMFKMKAAERTIKIIYHDNGRTRIELWNNIMRVDRIWYRIDIKRLEEIL